MSQLKRWRAHCFRQFVGDFWTLKEAKDACDRFSRHAQTRASVVNTQTGERWFRGSNGWRETAAGAEPTRAPMRHWAEVER